MCDSVGAMAVAPEDLLEAVEVLGTDLGSATKEDWSVAGTGDWTCQDTLKHLGDCLLSYAGQLAAQPQSRYVQFEAVVAPGATNEELLEFAVAAAQILASVAATSDPMVRAFHPTGRSDPEGFVSMGCVEVLLHGADIAGQFAIAFEPSLGLCERVLHRLFPEITFEDASAWDALRWATGRTSSFDGTLRTEWRWRGAPLDE